MKRVKSILFFVVLCAAVLLLAGCGPMISITNTTNKPIKVMVIPPKGGHSIISIEAKGSEGVEMAAGTTGTFTAVAILPGDWEETLKARRAALMAKLGDPETMKTDEVFAVLDELKQIQRDIDAYQKGGTGSACSATLTSENQAGSVTVSQGAQGKLVATCTSVSESTSP